MKEKVEVKTSTGKWYDVIILILSIYVLAQFSLEIILKIPERTQQVLTWIDFSICILFLIDWILFLLLSENKLKYIKTKSIDLIASIPFAQVLRPLRLLRGLRILKTLRLIRGAKGAVPLLRFLLKNPARSALTIYFSLTFVIYFYCSVGLYNYEKEHNDSISSFGDVLWMSFTTLTSVGYGGIYPVTTEGRVLAAILVICGVGMFSLLTAEFATLILKYVRKEKGESNE